MDLNENIKVFCRCRPLNEVEIKNGCTSIVDHESSGENNLQITCPDSSRKQFNFDHVFRLEDDQEAVFTKISPIVTSALDGYNVCIFAYGQTGTGKTFTMEGIPENRGVNYRTLENIFRISNERCEVMRYDLYASMLEVYNDKIRDLFLKDISNPSKKLEVKQASDGTHEVPGLVEVQVQNIEEILDLIRNGSRSRYIGSTNANELSSRSHCLLRLTLKGESLLNKERRKSHLWLVDLAGSERLSKFEVGRERLIESQHINKSLSTLAEVICALSSKAAYVPYRNSKLTHILRSSLGGYCKTLMLLQISPSSSDYAETLSSLHLGSRVRDIMHDPTHKPKAVVNHTRCEKKMKILRESVESLQNRINVADHTIKSLSIRVGQLEKQIAAERNITICLKFRKGFRV